MTIGRTSNACCPRTYLMQNSFRPTVRGIMPSKCPPRSGLLGASALLITAVLAGCGTTQQAGSMQTAAIGDSNIPAPPNVDRSKCSDQGKQVITADTNQDKKPDVWKFFAT